MENLAEKSNGPLPNDAHYSYIRSLNNDLVLLGNALMTRNNDINSIHDFVTDSINTIVSEQLRSTLHKLNEAVIGCDNDEDRLRLLAKMQHILAKEVLPYLEETFSSEFRQLTNHLTVVSSLKGEELKVSISAYQVDILRFIPGIDNEDYTRLQQQAKKTLEVSGKMLANNINTLYEDINLLIQPSFDDFDD